MSDLSASDRAALESMGFVLGGSSGAGGGVATAQRETSDQRVDRILWEVMSGARSLDDVRRSVDAIAGVRGTYGGANDDARIMGLGAAAVRQRILDIFRNRNVDLSNYGPTGGGGQQQPQKPAQQPRDYYREARLLFPWIPEALLPTFVEEWARTGDASLAIAAIRARPDYDAFFPGNKRPDGTVRLDEGSFLGTIEGYRSRLGGYLPQHVVDQILTPDRIRGLIEGDKSVDEFGMQLDKTYVGVISNAENVRAYFAENFGAGDISDAAIFAAAVNKKDLQEPMVFERAIRAAQIGGSGAEYGFRIARQEAERLGSFGLDQAGARRLYAQASTQLPRLNELLARHNDPDDEFTLDELTDALVLQSPDEVRQIERLYGQQASAFSGRGLFGGSRSGALEGLRQR